MNAPAGGSDRRAQDGQGGQRHRSIDPALKRLVLQEIQAAPGRASAVPVPVMARRCGVTPRTLQTAVEALALDGFLIGSSCSGDRPGLFSIRDEEDLRLGTGHLRRRAASMFARVRAVERAASREFGPQLALELFDLEQVR